MDRVKMGNYVKIKVGQLDANASNKNGKYPFFTCSNEPLKIDTYSYDCECVLVAGNGELNVKYYHGKFDAYQRTYIIETINKEILDTKYLYYLIDNNIESLRKKAIGGVIKYIKLGNLLNMDLKLFGIRKQKAIVHQLDEVQEIIDLRIKQIQELDKLVESKFTEMFGTIELNDKKFKEKELGSIAIVSSSRRIYAKEYQASGIPFYRSKEIVELGHNKKPTTELFISEKRYQEMQAKYDTPRKGDILITAIGTIGESWIVDTDEPFYYKDGNLLQIRLTTDVSQIYFKYVLDRLVQLYKKTNVSGSAYLALTIEKFKKMKMILPPIQLQHQFAEVVKKINQQKLELQKSLEQMQNLKQSLMNKYFKL